MRQYPRHSQAQGRINRSVITIVCPFPKNAPYIIMTYKLKQCAIKYCSEKERTLRLHIFTNCLIHYN